MSRIEQRAWGSTKEGEALIFTLTNSLGAKVELINIGAGIRSVHVPDHSGNLVNVTLGYADAESYLQDGPYMGKTPGRFANRIAGGRFTINGASYQLAINNGPNALHGGLKGFANEIWSSRIEGSEVVFYRTSPDGEENYPGNLRVSVSYEWTDNCELKINYVATTDAPTIINLTNHAYWNLRGESTGPQSMLEHRLHLHCSQVLEHDATAIPTGKLRPVQKTPMDFTNPKRVGQDIEAADMLLEIGHGYDQCFVVDEYCKGKLTPVGSLTDPSSGRKLEISSTLPGIQVYTGNYLEGCPKSISGNQYQNRSGIALECQAYPDAPNHDTFPSTLLQPGDSYNETIVYKFTSDQN
eukprot:Protomagalhaensia_sp_Gyna_25__1128@NODE_1552_length_1737_cov_232_387515_g1260_i0_p1_GENE_NODE_1552_length_1737_cov_232_387515_g1260_i0NODE_1552_length_1737_cov_232_387515_g1260_i0_p1_ORF_typecomplete_len354_score48_69Aldose_epim/PF01263_20/1_4e90_NODE_1552_length_1737_cov_232_387515_g1260_i05731634